MSDAKLDAQDGCRPGSTAAGAGSRHEHLGIGEQGIDAVPGKTVDAEAVGGNDGETTGHSLKDGHAPRLIA